MKELWFLNSTQGIIIEGIKLQDYKRDFGMWKFNSSRYLHVIILLKMLMINFDSQLLVHMKESGVLKLSML